jgi:hypothetical protein
MWRATFDSQAQGGRIPGTGGMMAMRQPTHLDDSTQEIASTVRTIGWGNNGEGKSRAVAAILYKRALF